MFKSTFLVYRRLPTINVCGKHSIQTETNSIIKQVQEVKIPVPWGHVAGKWWGRTDCQPLLGLHGWEDNAGTFDNLAPLLKVDGFLAIDFPGHGLSSHYSIGRSYFFMDSVLLLRYITKYFKWDKISVIGHSYGSATAFTYSAFFPDNVTNYISIDCARPLMSPDKNTELLHLRHICDSLMSLEEKLEKCSPPSYTYDTIVELLHKGSFESPSKESCKILLQRGMTKSAGTEDRYYFSRDPRLKLHPMMRFPDEFLLKFAEAATCNYLSIVANEGLMFDDRKEVYMKTVEYMKKSNYKVEHYEVEGTHHVHINNAERVAPFVNCFLNGKWWGPTNVKPLLGLHGWQDNAGTWDRLAPMLPSGVSLLAIDSPGHGFSSHFPHGHPYHLIDQMMVIRRIVTYYKWDKISLLSHSMGAIQSFIYTSIYPDQVENLIAVDAFKPLSVDPYTEIQKIGSQLDMFLEIDGRDESIKPSYTYDEMVEKLYHGMVSNSLTKESCKVLLKRGMLQSEHGYYFSRDVRLKVGRLTGWVQEFILEQASRIRCNVLFIKAKPGLVFEKAQINKEVLDVVKKSANIFEYHVVEGLHHVHLNDPEKVAPIINNFLNGSGYVLDLAMTSGY